MNGKIIIIIILLCVPILDSIYYNINEMRIPLYDYRNIKYRTGDILLFKWQDMNPFNKHHTKLEYGILDYLQRIPHNICCRFYWTHAAIVLVIDNIPYLYECIQIESYNYKKIKCVYSGKIIPKEYYGPILHKLCDISYFLGDVSHVSYIGPDIKKDKVFRMLKTHDRDVIKVRDKYIINYTNAFFKNCILKNTNKEKILTCSAFIASVLRYFGMRSNLLSDCSTPISLYNFCMKSPLYENCYSKIYKY